MEDVVIAGISGRLPESDSLEEFWENLINGVDMVTEDDRRWTPGWTYRTFLSLRDHRVRALSNAQFTTSLVFTPTFILFLFYGCALFSLSYTNTQQRKVSASQIQTASFICQIKVLELKGCLPF